ncbi:MAG: hypothetical protein ABIS92_00545 [Polyangia bacterium]
MGDETEPGGGVTPSPPEETGAPARAELADAPPFLSWRLIYLIVLGALAVEIAVGAAVTSLYR